MLLDIGTSQGVVARPLYIVQASEFRLEVRPSSRVHLTTHEDQSVPPLPGIRKWSALTRQTNKSHNDANKTPFS